jgi:cob(I)alamin adenosyltransferase
VTENKFREPRLALNRIYTRQGDHGQTSLVGGQRALKNALRIECYGTVDELNSFVGLASATIRELSGASPRLEGLGKILRRIQHELFNLGSILATMPEDVAPQQPRVTAIEVKQLETEIDEANAELPALRSFVLPGGSRLNAELHVCRTVCRRAERLVVGLSLSEGAPAAAIQYLNRLSDALFVWSRWASHVQGTPEVLWSPNEAASSSDATRP